MMNQPKVQAFFDEPTFTVSYLVSDPATKRALVIDPVLDFDAKSGKASHATARKLLAAAREQGLTIERVLETHAHADHLSAAPFLAAQTGAQTGIGNRIGEVQRTFAKFFNLANVSGDGREFNHLFADGERFKLGEIDAEVMHTPGHTPACVSYRIGDAVFVGDTMFMPDYGTARCDFPGGDARTLYRSLKRILALPPQTRLFMCHDYKAPGRDKFAWETTVGEQRAKNIHIHDGVSEDDYVAMRTKRDATLSAPVLLLPSIQVNIRAGALPAPESNGTPYLKLPITLAD
jgi:glyoxylase-like metal-dependent hydrolase (beta-lactamase superfamily II)